MKKNFYILTLVLALIHFSCGKSFLETKPQGQIIDEQLNTTKAVEAELIGAYGLLNGNINGTWGNYSTAPSQWLYGEVASDNAHKGSSNTDQSPMNDIELHKPNSTNDNLPTMWRNYYEGITRCNNTLNLLKKVQAENANDKFSDERAKEIEAEARMLRGHYYFFLRRVFANIPYLDESIASTEAATKVKNDVEVYPKIEDDLKFAVDNLTYNKPKGEIGRMDKYAAEAYLGKVYLYQKKYAEALVLFKDIITKKPALTTLAFQNNFNVSTENGAESIMTVQHVINADGSGDNGNIGDMLAGLYGTAPVNCCGFYQPSIDLVNSFKVGADGLPYLNGSYRTNPYKSDLGLVDKSGDSAKKYYNVDTTIAFDPRLDYTAGRRGVPYRDWGNFPGDDWIRDPAFGGPFVALKQMIDKAEFGGNTASGTLQINSLNFNLIRLADVYLMAAECAIETGDLPYALARVNDVRNRAALLSGKRAPILIKGSDSRPLRNKDGGDSTIYSTAAVYKVKPYGSFPTTDYARNAVRFERRLELALEGQRFYDLVRWGIAKQVLESYMTFEGGYISASKAINFADKDNYFPIPQQELDRAPGVLKQNTGY